MKINFIGHAAFMIESEGFKALIDPFITSSPVAKYNDKQLENITHIFVTHGHGDHLGDTVKLAQKNNALVICNFEIADYLTSQGVKCHSMHIGGRYTFDFGVVKMTPALHGSGINNDGVMIDGGNPCGFVITIDGVAIYHAGDTGLTMDMKLLAIEDIDVAILPIGGNYTMDIVDAARAVDFICPKAVIPIHYNTFDVINADPKKFEKLVGTKSIVHILEPGEFIDLV